MCSDKTKNLWLRRHSTGHLRARVSGGDQRLHGGERWKRKWGIEERLGDNLVGWLKTAASGEILLLPYVPGGITGGK